MNERRPFGTVTKQPGLITDRAKARLLRDIGPAEGTTEGGVDLHPRLYPPFGPAEIWEREPDYSRMMDAKAEDIFKVTAHTTGLNSTLTIASEDATIFLEHDLLLLFATGTDAVTPAAVLFKGGWDAETNDPALASGVGTAGDLYLVRNPGETTLDGVTSWDSMDWLLFSGGVWIKRDAPDGLNDLQGACVSDATIVGSVMTINTNLTLQTAAENGFVIRLVPAPKRVGRVIQVVNRWTDATLDEGTIVDVQQEDGSDWWDIGSGGCGAFDDDGLDFRGE